MASSCRIAIVGGGLAGLAAAQSLKAFGIETEVFETAPALGEIGAAVNASPQAVKALQAIGVGDKVAAVGHLHRPASTPATCRPASSWNSTIGTRPGEKYGAPYYTFHRADLLDALASGLDRSAIHLGHRLTGLEERSDRIVLAFANGARRRSRIRDRRRRRALGHPPDALWRRQSDLYGPDGVACAARTAPCAGRSHRADRPYPVGRAGLPSARLLHPRHQAW